MGFTKWLFKSGPGSIGATSRICVKSYIDALKNNDETDDEVKIEAFQHVIAMYVIATKMIYKSYNPSESDAILRASNGCLAMLCWILVCEEFKNIQAIWGNQKVFDISAEVVYETVKEKSSSSIKMTFLELKLHALGYLKYRLEENNYSSDNSNIDAINVWYKSALINKSTNKIETFNDEFLFRAKEKFNELNDTYDSYKYIIWTIEMEENKYKFVHYCNDNQFKNNINNHIKITDGMFRFTGIDD